MLKKISLLVFCLATLHCASQELLSKKEALELTLKHNFGIKMATNNVKVAKNNTGIYNTGFLPTVALNSGANYTNNNQNLVFTDRDTNEDSEIGGKGIISKNYSASVGLNYTLFDGLGRKYNYKQLKETYNLTELQAKETIENTYLQLFTSYFQIARLTATTLNLNETLTISKNRLKRANYAYDYGQNTKLDVFNAVVDVNNDSIALINSKQQLLNAKRSLLLLLGTKKDINFNVETEVDFLTILNLEDLKQKTLANNSVLNQTKKNIAITKFNVKINKANYLPTLNFNAGYSLNRTENENLINPFGARLITSDGLNAGLNLTWNIFDGGATKTRVANAKIALENQEIALEEQKTTVLNTLENLWYNYKNQRYVISAQKNNVLVASTNFVRTQEQYKLGQVTSIAFRQAQINMINAKNLLTNAKYDAKLIELQLLQLSGDILNVKF